MASRRAYALLLLATLASMGATYPTPNFVVEAPTPQIAQQVGQAAEYFRKAKSLEWLGYEMPAWPERCPLKVHLTLNGPGGATSFAFDRGRVLGQTMHIEGQLDRLVSSVLPHEVTHTVFAYYFRCPLPRWADEGGAVLSEDDIEKDRHDRLVRQILNTPGRKIPLRRLFTLKDYPGDVMVLYAEGFSVANFLVNNSNRQTFLGFVAQGMTPGYGWDYAVKAYYRYNSVEELEEAWLAHLRATRRQPMELAQNTPHNPSGEPTSRVILRRTVPPVLPAPVYRGQSDDSEREAMTAPALTARPGYLPDYTQPPHIAEPPPGWTPHVELGAPLPVQRPAATIDRPVPETGSPVGYPR